MRWFASVSGKSEKIAVLLSRAIDMAGGLVFLKLISTHASKADMGTYMLATSIVALLLTVSFSAISQGVLRNVSDYLNQGELPQRYTAALIGYLITAPLYAWLALNLIKALGISDVLSPYIFLIVIWVASDALKTLNTSVAAAMRQRYLIAAASALDYCIKLAAIGFCILEGRLNTTMIILIMAFASATVGLFFIAIQKTFLTKTSFSIFTNTIKQATHFAWPMMIWGAFGWAQSMSGRWIVEKYLGAESVASLGVITTIGSLPVNAIFGVVITYVQPIIYEIESKKIGSSRQYINKIIKIIAPILMAMLFVSCVYHYEIITIATSQKYGDVSGYLPVVVGSVILSSIGSALSYVTLAKKRTSSLLIANTLPGFLSIVLGFLLIPKFGLSGAVATVAVSHLLSFLLLVVNHQKQIKS
jgi:O-antigen/teichoic acid export membrane protein